MPFDWTIATKSGVIADLVRLPGAKDSASRALLVEFHTGQIDFPGITQTLLVRPGAYRVKGRYKGTLVGRRGLKWHVACLEQPVVWLGESQMFVGVAADWQSFSFPIVIAPSNCGAQQLKLELDARSASERLVSGSIMFADLEIARDEMIDVPKN